jgi:hypothetical protein
MSTRILVVVWIAIGIVVWNGMYDRYVAEGAREYLQVVAETEAGYAHERTLPDVMSWWKHTGAVTASGWAIFVVLSGWTTIWLARRTRA